MAILFRIPTYLRTFTGGRGDVSVNADGRTVNDALAALWKVHPGLRDRVVTEQNGVREYLNIFVGAENIRDRKGLATEVTDGCEITIVPSVAGGETTEALEAKMHQREPSALFLEYSRRKLLHEYWPRLRECVESLTDEQVWWRPNDASNSVANLILHLNGNVGQWLVSPFSGVEDLRNRPAEFSERQRIPAAALLARLGATMQSASEVLARLTETDLLATFQIQGYTVSGLGAVYQVVEHFGMHYGQIVFVTKLLRGQDLGFYRELDKTGRRESR
jgi:molybdopterin converting factor small subunit